jgi:hypothetical protein
MRLEPAPPDAWFRAYETLSIIDSRPAIHMWQIVSLVVPRACFASLWVDDEILACGMGVLEREYGGLCDVVTHPGHRN